MKKFLIIAAVLLLVMSAFSIVSFADASTDVNVGDVPNTLSVPAGSDYAFYAQTRTNRLDSNKKDVRIICVADQEWITSIPNFVATFTFTDGSTPVSLKSVGLDVVFKEVVTYGTNGNVETYAAADGAVIFGWVITDVPAEYADVAANKPTISVTTEAGVKPEAVMPDVDYDAPVSEKNDINVETDGIYQSVETNINGKVGGFDHGDSRATYILTGNYEGIYELEVFYTCHDGGHRGLIITANGVSQNFQIMEYTDSWDDVSTARSFKVQVQLKSGANVISFSKSGDYAGFNVVDFDLKKVYDLPAGETITVLAPSDKNDETDSWTLNGGEVEGVDNGAHKIGWLMEGRTATSTLTDVAAGDYLLAVYYLNNDKTYNDPRMLKIIVNGEEYIFHASKNDTWNDTTKAIAAYVKVTLVDGENTITVTGTSASVVRPDSGRTDAPGVTKYTLTAYAE